VAAHLPFVARSLEDIDSINFALGLQRFDVAAHQPHPPGYPLYIALGRVLHGVVRAVHPGEPFHETAALALALLSAVGGGVVVWAWTRASGSLDSLRSDASRATQWWSVGVVACAPLLWVSALRPMSDIVGLALALVVLAILAADASRAARAQLVVAAGLAGLAGGVRVQTALLTLPPLALVVWRRRAPWSEVRTVLAALVAGGAVWALPLVWFSGGVSGYWRALGSQAGEDFSWVEMLWTHPTPRRLAQALLDSFVAPWSRPWLAGVVLLLATVGALAALARREERPALGLVAVAFAPYAVFHLLLQETSHVRYALPLVVPVGWTAAHGIVAAGRVGQAVGLLVVGTSLWQAVDASVAYRRERHPAFRAVEAMTDRAPDAPDRVYSHYALYRAVQVAAPSGVTVVAPARNQEWLGPVEYWRTGGRADVWFLADPRRMDLDLFDTRAVRRGQALPWSVSRRPEFGGARPVGAELLRVLPPRWMTGPGWSLSPEAGGRVRAERTGPDRQPVEAYLRRGPEPLVAVLGGRYLGPPDGPGVGWTVDVDGTPVDTWTFDHQADANFLRVIQLPQGVADGAADYATLRVTARSTTGKPLGELAIRQFDVTGARGPLVAFASGWHEDESTPATGARWRWSSDRSDLFIVATDGATLVIRGESPVKYFGRPPLVRLVASGRTLAEFRPDADFEWRVPIPPGTLDAAGGTVTLMLDRAYLPGPAEGTSDTRRLGLRTFSIRLER
jgi:hypothetical protein